jgi:hypothetical protein
MVTGVCLIERGNNWQAGVRWRAASFHLLLRSAQDVVVTNSPVAVSAPDGVGVAVAFGLAALAALIWVIVLKRKVRQLAKR